ncbi:MAG: YjgN family protein [Alphaproteobacteria bacterium]|nr:YjgN family protein [Alphaproteobacteria bacterium]
MTDLTLEQPPEAIPPQPTEAQPQAEAAQSVAGGRVTVKANRIGYSGQTGSVYKIWLLNIFLTVITLGIYSFWGKTRLRRYIMGCFKLGGDHFEYTGTGKELFIGFLKVLPVIIALYAGAFFLPPQMVVIIYLPILYLFPVAIFMAMRYRLNRLTWRGIRARLTGSPFRFGGFALWRMFLNIISFGILIPASDIATYGYMVNRAGIGNVRAKFDGKVSALIRTHIVTLILCVVGAGVITGVIVGMTYLGMPTLDENDPASKAQYVEQVTQMMSGAIFIGIFLSVGWIMLVRSYYHAALMREKMRGLTLGKIRFKCTATGFDVLKLRLGNLLIIVFTLGLGFPVVIQRRMRFMADKLMVGGDLDDAQMMQAARESGAAGEGLDDLFGIDADLGIG